MEEKLIEAAVSAVTGVLTKAAIEPALTSGRRIWDWVKGNVSGNDANTIAVIEQSPTKPSVPLKISGLLMDILHGNPTSAAELRSLLASPGGVQAVTQTANVTGRNNIVAQAAGNHNTIRMG